MKILYNDGHAAECPEAEELEVLRHSAAHIMAQAVKRLYPDAHFAYGTAVRCSLRGILRPTRRWIKSWKARSTWLRKN